MHIQRQIINGDVAIIAKIDTPKKNENNEALFKNNSTNDFTNTHLGFTYAKNKEEEKKNKNNENDKINNHEEIIVRSNKYNTTNTIIEVRLPNPYLDTECVKFNKYIDYNIQSKFKSKFADYINSKSNKKREIKSNKTFKVSSLKIDQHIYFTKKANKEEKK